MKNKQTSPAAEAAVLPSRAAEAVEAERATACAAGDPSSSLAVPDNGIRSSSQPGLVFVRARSRRAERAGLVLLFASILAVLAVLGFLFLRLEDRDIVAARNLDRFERRIQRLDAGIPFDARRQSLLLAIRDRIGVANSTMSLQDAYRYAELIVETTESYADVPPLLLLSMGIVGSSFHPEATGPRDARGLYQIRPSTGRMLARMLKWEFGEEMLFDPEVNTKLAALFLDVLFAEYGDLELVLADYHGGARAAGLLKTSEEEVSPETRAYVLEVKELYERLGFELGSSEALTIGE